MSTAPLSTLGKRLQLQLDAALAETDPELRAMKFAQFRLLLMDLGRQPRDRPDFARRASNDTGE